METFIFLNTVCILFLSILIWIWLKIHGSCYFMLSGVGSGLYGSLKSSDLSAAGAVGAAGDAPAAAAPAPAPGASYVDIPLSSMRATIAKRLSAAKQTIPHYQLTATVNVEKTIAMRKTVNEKLEAEKAGVKVPTKFSWKYSLGAIN